jgi:cystathionine beta-lyase
LVEEWCKRIGFSSGLAATDCLMRGLKAGDEVIAMDDCRGLTDCLQKYIKIQDIFHFVDMNDMENSSH